MMTLDVQAKRIKSLDASAFRNHIGGVLQIRLEEVDADQLVKDNMTDFIADLSPSAMVDLLDEIGEAKCREHFGIKEE